MSFCAIAEIIPAKLFAIFRMALRNDKFERRVGVVTNVNLTQFLFQQAHTYPITATVLSPFSVNLHTSGLCVTSLLNSTVKKDKTLAW